MSTASRRTGDQRTEIKIGFIGVGNMGNPMCANLIKAGFPTTVHDVRRERAEDLVALGATWADSPADAASLADVVVLCLPSEREVEAVALGAAGVLFAMRPGTSLIDTSTSAPELVRRMAEVGSARGIAVLDAPVSGAVDGARNGTLAIFVGGDRVVVERHRPVFDALGTRIFHAGPLGAGLAAKLLTNLLWYVHAAAIGEAMVLGVRAGIDLLMIKDIIEASCGTSWVATHDIPTIYRGDYDTSFSLELCAKDLRLIMQLGRMLGVPLELGGHAEDIFRRARDRYGAAAGELSVVRLVEDAVGVRLEATGSQR